MTQRIHISPLRLALLAAAGLALAAAPRAARAQDLYVSDFGNNAVQEYAPDGTFVRTFATGISEPDGLAYANGSVFVASNNTATSTGQIARYALNTAGSAPTLVFGSGLSDSITGLAVDGAGSVYVSDYNNNAVKEFSASGAPVTSFTTSINAPVGLAFDANGALYVASSTNNSVVKLTGLANAAGPTVTPFATTTAAPQYLAFGTDGTLYVATAQGTLGNGSVSKFSATGTASGTLEDGTGASDPSSPYGLARLGTSFFVSDLTNNDVVQYSSSGTYTRTITSGLSQPYGLLAAPASTPEPSSVLALLTGAGTLTLLAARRRARVN